MVNFQKTQNCFPKIPIIICYFAAFSISNPFTTYMDRSGHTTKKIKTDN